MRQQLAYSRCSAVDVPKGINFYVARRRQSKCIHKTTTNARVAAVALSLSVCVCVAIIVRTAHARVRTALLAFVVCSSPLLHRVLRARA